MKFMKEVVALKNKCLEFLTEVADTGNECAYTDRIVEEIIEKSNVLKNKYEQL